MTKRFQIIGENYTNIDMPVFIICRENDCCFEVYESKEDAERVCDKLNHLIDENEQLKQSLSSTVRELRYGVKKVQRLAKENEQLKFQLQNTSLERDEFHRGARENANLVGKLKKENKQLKEKLNEIKNGLISDLEKGIGEQPFVISIYLQSIIDLIGDVE